MIYICFPVYNRLELTKKCLDSIFNSTYKNYKVVLLDDGSIDNTTFFIKNNYPNVIILKGDGTYFWAKGMNTCLKYVLTKSNSDDYTLMLNNDVEVTPSLLNDLITKSNQLENNCIIGSINLIINSNDLIENSAFVCKRYFIFNTFRAKFRHNTDLNLLNKELTPVDTIAAKGAFLSISCLKRLGLIDDIHFRQYHGDATFFYRAKYLNIPIYVYKFAKLYSHLELTGIGSTNKINTTKEIFISFFSFKSANYYRSIYHRSLILNKNNIIISLLLTLSIVTFKIFTLFRIKIFLNAQNINKRICCKP